MKFLLQSAFSFLLLSLLPSMVWAQTYHLPTNPPPGCSASGNVVSCSNWITLGSGVVITVSSPVTFNLNGRGAIEGAQINVGGSPANLTVNVNGGLNLGSNTNLFANITASAVSGSGASNVRITGALTVGGQLQLGGNAQLAGTVTADTFSTGANSVINADMNLQGNFSPSNGTQVIGTITAASIQASGVSNLNIQGDINLSGQLALGSQSQITGNVVAGSLGTGQNNTISGDVSVSGTLGLGQGSTINGNVAGNLINIFNQASVTGTVQSDGNVNLSPGAAVGPVTAWGSLSAGTNVVINGGIDVEGQVTLGEYSVVHGGIQAGEQVSIHDHVVIHGGVATTGQVTVNDDVTVYGGVTAGTNIQIHNRSHIHGDLAGHQIDISLDAMIEGNVEAQGVVTNAGVIQGNVNAKGPVWLNGNGSCSVENDGRLEPESPTVSNTQGCVRGYVNAPNADHIQQNNPGNVGGLVCDQNVNEGPCTGAGGPGVTFYRIINPGTVLTCESLALQVQACADANCLTGQPLTGSVTVQAAGPQTYSSIGSFANSPVSSTVNMTITTAGTYTLDVTAAPELASVQCQGPNGCDVMAVDSVLRWNETGYSDIRHQTAGMPFQLEIEAIRTDTQTGACAAALQDVATLDIGLDCWDPGTCSSDGLEHSSVAETELSEWPATSTIPVDFDANGRAVLGDMIYEDAGRIRLHASADTGVTSIAGWSNDFVVRPAVVGIQVSTEATYNSSILARAGDDLVVTLSALSGTGRVTRNFGRESSPESLVLLPQAMTVSPPDGVNGSIVTQHPFVMSQEGGEFTGTIRYSEAGTAIFTAQIAGPDYMMSGAGVTGQKELGRFLPWEFRVEATGTMVKMACSALTPGFTYLGEPFKTSLRVSARNWVGAVTQNYPDEGAGASATLVARDTQKDVELSDRLYKDAEPMQAMPLVLTWTPPPLVGSGYGVISTDVVMERLPFDWGDPANAGPFEQVVIGVEVDDNEVGGPFVPLANADFRADTSDCAADDSCTAVTLAEDLRFVYGRMVLTDTFGSEFSNLPVTLQVHYWDGDRFRLHQADQCTVVDGEGFDITENLQELATDAQGPGPDDGVTLINGSAPTGSLMLTAPGEPGEVIFEYEARGWLKFGEPDEESPSARGTFGTYGGHDRVIHWRLVH